MAERRVGDETDAELAQNRQHFGSGSRVHSEYSDCSAVIGMHGVGAADGVGAGFGQPDVADLALGDQFGERADGLFDRRVRVDAVLVVQVDVVGAEPPQRSLDGGADVRGAAVRSPGRRRCGT